MQTTAIQTEEPITIEQAAEFLKMTVRTVREKAASGIIPARKPAKRYLFFKTELTTWLKSSPNKNNA